LQGTVLYGPLTIGFFAFLALAASRSKTYRGFAFTLWVAAFVAAALFYPEAFRTWFGYELGGLIVPLIQIIMFGMGTQLTVADFQRVLAMPRAVLIGMALQFLVMPFVGFGLAALFTTDPEVAAGIILVGSAPGGVASNVMTYLARGNVALSVTMTACSTLAAPIMTPMMMTLLAGAYVEVGFSSLMLSIINMIIVPVIGGLVANMALTRLGRSHPVAASLSDFIMRVLPFISMFSICFIIGIITSLSREALLAGGFVLAVLVAVILHNGLGYLFGYWGSRLLGLRKTDCRTVAIEVGLQNAGMASGLAIEVLKSPLAAIPPAIFGPWMNMSGAILASWWKNRPPEVSVSAPEKRVSTPAPVPGMSEERSVE